MADPADDPGLVPFDPYMLRSDLPDPNTVPRFPSGLGWHVGREYLAPWELPGAAELRNPPDRPQPYLETKLNEAPITPADALPFMGAAALPGIVVQSGRVGPRVAALLSHPATAMAAGPAMEGLSDILQRGEHEALPYALDAADKIATSLMGTPAQAEDLPQNQWYTPQGTLKIGPKSSSDQIKALQTFLQGSNEYKGPIDGVWKGQTAGAAQAFGDRIHQDYLSDQASAKAKSDAENSAAALAAAKANQETAAAKASAESAASAKRDADAKAFGDFATQYRADHPISGFAQDHPVATALGVGALSFGTGLGLQRVLANKLASGDATLAQEARAAVRRAGAADIDTGAGRGERASELNAYWDKGGSAVPPFVRKGPAWANQNGTPDASTLYAVGPGKQLGRETLAGFLTGGAEGAAEFLGGTDRMNFYQKQLDDAKGELNKGFTPERARAVLDAQDNLAMFQALQRGSYGAFISSAAGAGKGMLSGPKTYPTNYGAATRYREELAQKIQDLKKRKP